MPCQCGSVSCPKICFPAAEKLSLPKKFPPCHWGSAPCRNFLFPARQGALPYRQGEVPTRQGGQLFSRDGSPCGRTAKKTAGSPAEEAGREKKRQGAISFSRARSLWSRGNFRFHRVMRFATASLSLLQNQRLQTAAPGGVQSID